MVQTTRSFTANRSSFEELQRSIRPKHRSQMIHHFFFTDVRGFLQLTLHPYTLQLQHNLITAQSRGESLVKAPLCCCSTLYWIRAGKWSLGTGGGGVVTFVNVHCLIHMTLKINKQLRLKSSWFVGIIMLAAELVPRRHFLVRFTDKQAFSLFNPVEWNDWNDITNQRHHAASCGCLSPTELSSWGSFCS